MRLPPLLILAFALLCIHAASSTEITIRGCGLCGENRSETSQVPLDTCFDLRQSDFCKNGSNNPGHTTITEQEGGYLFCVFQDSNCGTRQTCADNPLPCGVCNGGLQIDC